MKKQMQIKQYLIAMALGLGLVLGVSSLQAAWTNAPAGGPPNCPAGSPGCDAPLNVGPSLQTKIGGLWINSGLRVDGALIFSANAGANRVLTSDAVGNATWQPNASYATNFTFNRTAAAGGDRRIWCPASHPNLISCSISAGDAPSSPEGFDGCNNPLAIFTNSDSCHQGANNSVNPDQPARRKDANIGTDMIYIETIKTNNIMGCLTYDNGHSHKPYRVDTICSI